MKSISAYFGEAEVVREGEDLLELVRDLAHLARRLHLISRRSRQIEDLDAVGILVDLLQVGECTEQRLGQLPACPSRPTTIPASSQRSR